MISTKYYLIFSTFVLKQPHPSSLYFNVIIDREFNTIITDK